MCSVDYILKLFFSLIWLCLLESFIISFSFLRCLFSSSLSHLHHRNHCSHCPFLHFFCRSELEGHCEKLAEYVDDYLSKLISDHGKGRLVPFTVKIFKIVKKNPQLLCISGKGKNLQKSCRLLVKHFKESNQVEEAQQDIKQFVVRISFVDHVLGVCTQLYVHVLVCAHMPLCCCVYVRKMLEVREETRS